MLSRMVTLWPRNQIEIAILGSLALKHHVSLDFVQNADVYCLSNPRDSQRVPPPEIDELKIRQINYSFFTSIQSNLKPQVVIGIPTSLKPWQGTENLRKLLAQLLTKPPEGVEHDLEQEFRIVVALTDKINWRQRIVVEELRKAFPVALKSGVLSVVSVPVEYYPWDLVLNPCALQKHFFESLDVTINRALEVVHTAFLMQYAAQLDSEFYIHLSDVVSLSLDSPWLWLQIVANVTSQLHNKEWAFVTFAQHHTESTLMKFVLADDFSHSVGVLYRNTYLSSLAQWLYRNFDKGTSEYLIGRYFSSIAHLNAFRGPSLFTITQSDADPSDTSANESDDEEIGHFSASEITLLP
jgi:hypothetical protein